VNPVIGQATADLIESKDQEEKIERRLITRRNSQPLVVGRSNNEEGDSRRGSAVSVESLAGRSDPGICSSFLIPSASAELLIASEETLTLVPQQQQLPLTEGAEEREERADIDDQSNPITSPLPCTTDLVNMIMDPIEPLSHVNLSGDSQPFSLSLSFDSYKIDSSDSSDLPDKSLISSSVVDPLKGTITGHEMRSGSSISGHRKRTLSPDLVPGSIQVLEKRRRKNREAAAAAASSLPHHTRRVHAHDPDHESEGEGDEEDEDDDDGEEEDDEGEDEESSSPNDTLNTPVSKKTDGPSFFPNIVTSIGESIPITGTFKFHA
jgi:hypothetical protein